MPMSPAPKSVSWIDIFGSTESQSGSAPHWVTSPSSGSGMLAKSPLAGNTTPSSSPSPDVNHGRSSHTRTPLPSRVVSKSVLVGVPLQRNVGTQ
jgi:hypothetical protein